MKKKTEMNWKSLFLDGVLGIIIGVSIVTLVIDFRNWDEPVLTRKIIENFDVIKEHINNGEIRQAKELIGCQNTLFWYLRNSKDTFFYDSVWYHKGYWVDGGTDFFPDMLLKLTPEKIDNLQAELCPRSDLSSSYMKANGRSASYINDRARC